MEYKVLYLFANETHVIAEIKRTDLGEEASPSEKFYWLIFEVEKQILKRLNFISMSTKEGKEYRSFEQGNLYFDANKAFYSASNIKLELIVSESKRLPINITEERLHKMCYSDHL